MPEVTAEEAEAGMELLEDNGLGLYLADLLSDNPIDQRTVSVMMLRGWKSWFLPLGHLLENKEALLDDLNRLGMADDLVLLDYGLGEVDRAIEVVRAVEIIETIEGGMATPVVEGVGGTSNCKIAKSVLCMSA